ncbi:hypothetical protein BD847_3444 [Flavobacterium cutihirudinis]|uniref:Uncharacterized protein n=1 Tax=Flavobacterium cutihirudinis TaxID=1265740 RepID=A0A3D9FNP7_9FLAO|nr:hypothetical protein [Flavobacterium cutihirudinis]RED21955.1 hypothetical protein BD847_3444 [Flavobacterium cutihirudinis]
MIKKFVLLSLVASQLMISCSSDDNNPDETKPDTELTLEEQIANLAKQPYSKLAPTEQKAKLEIDANEMLVQLDKSKSSNAIEAIENLNRLLDLSSIDIFDGKNDNEVEDILNVSGVYGIYTWNNGDKKWVKTASETELKFVFPAKETQTANNATFSAKSVSSDIKVKYNDSYIYSGNGATEINDWFFLPNSSDAVLTIDGTSSATFTQTAKYSNGKEVPNEFAYKMTVNDGYSWEMSGSKATANTSKASFTYNGKNLISFNAGSTAQIDALIDNDELVQYRGKANGLIQIMDNFVIIAEMDLAAAAADEAALEKSVVRPTNYESPTFDADLSNYYKKTAEGEANSFNKNMKLILVSKKDGTKIADVVQHADKEENDGSTVDYYYSTSYLKFNDSTEVEMGAYFSTGFENLKTKFEDFLKAFNKE